MSERLLSVGLDVGTTSTQLVLSELLVENRASSFAVPEMEIAQRRILYRSDVHFTPILEGDLVDGTEIRHIVEKEYQKAGILRQQVDTGAIIITGETSRRENAARVLSELSEFAGDFVVATAGPELESILAAKGAGAVDYSRQQGKTVLHMDIGGGTSNLALIRDGMIEKTGCLNVGGRLIRLDSQGRICYVSPVLEGLISPKPGMLLSSDQAEEICRLLVEALEMAAGLRPATELLERLWTREDRIGSNAPAAPLTREEVILSFSGGVADCIETPRESFAFGDIGPVLGRAIRQSRLCRKAYMLGRETIRATVIGAGCHSTQLSGSTVFCRNVTLPMKNLPVAVVPEGETDLSQWLRRKRLGAEGPVVFAFAGIPNPSYAQVVELAETIRDGVGEGPVLLALEQDMAKALGQALSLRMGPKTSILCLDRVKLAAESYLDVGRPVGPALPVVVKTLVLSK